MDSVSEKVQKRVNEYLKRPNFNEEHIRSKSNAAADLCAWIIAVINYAKEAKENNSEELATLERQ